MNGAGMLALAGMALPAGSGMTMLGRRSRCTRNVILVFFRLVDRMTENPARYLEAVMGS